MVKYEYAISAGPGTLVDVGEIDREGYIYSYMAGDDGPRDVSVPWHVPKLHAVEHMLQGHTIIIGPVEDSQ